MRNINRWIIVLFIMAALLLAACSANQAATTKIEPAQLEPLGDGNFNRVILTDKAAQRLDIQTQPVREQEITRTIKVGGQVLVAPSISSGSGEASSPNSFNGVLLRVPMSDAEEDMVDLSQPARVVTMSDETMESDLEAEAIDFSTGDDPEDNDIDESLPDIDPEEGVMYYLVRGENTGLAQGQGVFVELTLTSASGAKMVVPYASVLYGVNGETWVYTSPESNVFVRQPISIEYIDQDLAVLTDGPTVGTQVVTVGAAELFGTETGVSK
jgi:hypothetical protein